MTESEHKEPLITIDIKNKSFAQDQILGPIRLDINDGDRIALLGPSGIGKSTLLRIIAGLDTQFSGDVKNTTKTGMVFQQPTLLAWRNCIQNITLVTGVDEERAAFVMAEFHLQGKEHFFPQQLSLGQQRRMALARAFAYSPNFLIMDEPFTSLDEALVTELLELTREVVEKHAMTSLLVTHSKREAEYLGDRILRLEGSPAHLT